MTSPDDDIEIRNLVARVARFADTGTVEQYLEGFAEDIVFEIPERPPSTGIEELKDRTMAQRSAGVVGPSSGSMHLLGASAIEVDGDRGVAYTPWVVCGTPRHAAISLVGRYEDELIRTASGWRIRRRVLEFV